MKKLFTYLMLWLTAVSADVQYVPAGDIPFTSPDDYYNGHDHVETDYQELYESYVGAESTEGGCVVSHLKTQDESVNVPISSENFMWMLYSSDANQEEPEYSTEADTVSLGAYDGQIIISPGYCTVITDAAVSRNGTYMQLEVGEGAYTITLTNMERWFCCMYRDASEKTEAGFTHSSNAKGTVLRQGEIVGVATEDTTILIQKGSSSSGKIISLKEFYTGSK